MKEAMFGKYSSKLFEDEGTHQREEGKPQSSAFNGLEFDPRYNSNIDMGFASYGGFDQFRQYHPPPFSDAGFFQPTQEAQQFQYRRLQPMLVRPIHRGQPAGSNSTRSSIC